LVNISYRRFPICTSIDTNFICKRKQSSVIILIKWFIVSTINMLFTFIENPLISISGFIVCPVDTHALTIAETSPFVIVWNIERQELLEVVQLSKDILFSNIVTFIQFNICGVSINREHILTFQCSKFMDLFNRISKNYSKKRCTDKHCCVIDFRVLIRKDLHKFHC
jgi:hypothetical protein